MYIFVFLSAFIFDNEITKNQKPKKHHGNDNNYRLNKYIALPTIK